MKPTALRPLVALATLLICLLALPSPASAVAHNAEITGGTFRLSYSFFTQAIPLASVSCNKITMGLDITPDTHTPASITVNALSGQARFTSGTSTYVVVFTRTSSTAGTISSTGAISSMGVTLNLKLYSLAATTTCGLATLLCEYGSLPLVFQGTYSTFPVAVNATGSVNNGSSWATIPTPTGPCSGPFSLYVGGTAGVSSFLDPMAFKITS